MIIKKPDSVLTSLNSKSNKSQDNLLMKKKGIILEPIKDNDPNTQKPLGILIRSNMELL